MAATAAFKRAVLDSITARGAVITLHSADPGTTGANELAGGGYAAKLTVWPAAVDGAGGDAGKAVATGSQQTFDVEAGDTAAWWGCWAGTVGARGAFLFGRPLTPSIAIAGANGQIAVTPVQTYGDPA